MKVKKLITKKEQEKKIKRNYIILGTLIVLLLIISPAGYVILRDNSESNNKVIEYKNIKFIKDNNNYWQFQYNGMNFITKYNPKEINATSSTFLSLEDYRNKVLYFEWNDTREGYEELARNLFYLNQIPLRIQRACIENCSEDFPIKSCSEDNIISFRTAVDNEKERIYKEENCIFIISNETNQVEYADAFLFDLLELNK